MCLYHSDLQQHVIMLGNGKKTIDFSNSASVFHLNKAILMTYYGLKDWFLPKAYLCAPIPGRADYIHHLSDFLSSDQNVSRLKGLDIGVGANCIYPILAVQIYGWHMVGADSNATAVAIAQKNVDSTPKLNKHIEIRLQANNTHIFQGIIKEQEFFDFTMCNPPFYSSEAEAVRSTTKKNLKLGISHEKKRNFSGQANELWCNGGEALFIKRMIKQSILFRSQVGWFTSLVAKKEHLPKLIKQLQKLKATHPIIPMEQGHKKSRILAWTFRSMTSS